MAIQTHQACVAAASLWRDRYQITAGADATNAGYRRGGFGVLTPDVPTFFGGTIEWLLSTVGAGVSPRINITGGTWAQDVFTAVRILAPNGVSTEALTADASFSGTQWQFPLVYPFTPGAVYVLELR